MVACNSAYEPTTPTLVCLFGGLITPKSDLWAGEGLLHRAARMLNSQPHLQATVLCSNQDQDIRKLLSYECFRTSCFGLDSGRRPAGPRAAGERPPARTGECSGLDRHARALRVPGDRAGCTLYTGAVASCQGKSKSSRSHRSVLIGGSECFSAESLGRFTPAGLQLFGSDRIQTRYRGLETSSLAGLAPGYYRCFCNRLLQ